MKKIQRLVIIFLLMFKIGAFTFGGGWSIIAQMQAEFVDRRGWMTEEQIADYMSLAKSFPGIMIINMSVFCGFAMNGVSGAVAAAFGLSAPALLAIAVVTYFYASLRDNIYVIKILNGVRSVVVPIIISACLRLKKTAIHSKVSWLLVFASFILCVMTGINKLLLVAVSLVLGMLIWKGKNDGTVS